MVGESVKFSLGASKIGGQMYSGKAFEMVADFSAAQDALSWIGALLLLGLLFYMLRRV